MAVFGRWIVDCGHSVSVPVPDPGPNTFRSEIHPPLIMASAKVATGSIATGSPTGPPVTRVLFTSRPHLVSQRFTTDLKTIYDDTAGDDGPFVTHLLTEVGKANSIILAIPTESVQVEAHPKIKSHPFLGANLVRFVVRPPTAGGHRGPGGGAVPLQHLAVSFQFTVRSGCAVQVISSDSVDVFVALSSAGYTPPPLPKRNDQKWHKDELRNLDPEAASAYTDAEWISALYQLLNPLGSILNIPTAEKILSKGIKTDEYDTSGLTSVNILDANHAVSAPANNIPGADNQSQLASLQRERDSLASEVISDEGDLRELESEGQRVNPTLLAKARAKLAADKAKLKQIDDQIAALKAAVAPGVVQNDDQPYPIYGWLELWWQEPVVRA